MHSLVLVVVSDVLSALSHPQHCYMLYRVADIYSSHLAATYLPVGAHSSSNLKFHTTSSASGAGSQVAAREAEDPDHNIGSHWLYNNIFG
jgi:hypothetical protein